MKKLIQELKNSQRYEQYTSGDTHLCFLNNNYDTRLIFIKDYLYIYIGVGDGYEEQLTITLHQEISLRDLERIIKVLVDFKQLEYLEGFQENMDRVMLQNRDLDKRVEKLEDKL